MKLVAKHGEDLIPVEISRAGDGFHAKVGEMVYEVDFLKANDLLVSIRLGDGRQYTVVDDRDGAAHLVFFDNARVGVEVRDPLQMQRSLRESDVEGDSRIRAVMPGRVIRVLVAKGDSVEKGAPLVVLEAMKMENEIRATRGGTVESVFVTDGQTVDSGADLIEIV